MISISRRALMRFSGSAAALASLPFTVCAEDAPATTNAPLPPIEAFAASPLIDEVALSPDGKRVAMVTQSGDTKILMTFDVADIKPQTLRLGSIKIRNLFWGNNDQVVLIDSQTTSLPQFTGRKQEMSLGRVIDLRTSKLRTLFERQDDFYSIVVGGVTRVKVDGEYRLMAANYRMTGEYNLCLFSFGLTKSDRKAIYESSKDTENYVIAPDGYVVAYAEFIDDRKRWTLYYNRAPRGKMCNFKAIYELKEALDYPSLLGLGRDGASVVVYFSKGETKGEYHEINAEGIMGPSLDTSDDDKGTNPLFHPVTRRFTGFARTDDWVEYDYEDPLLKKLVAALSEVLGEDYRASIVEFAEDPRKMIIYGENGEDAGTYYFADLSTGDVIQLAVNYEQLPTEWITEKKPITYKAADGLEIHGYLTLPPRKTAKALPLVVLPHGGPQARDHIDFDWQVQALAANGYAVLQPNFRGSSGYSSSFVNAGHGEFGRKMQTDLSDGVRDLVKQGIVDPKRVAIMGASYGGYAALAGATLDPGIYNCAISIAGISDAKSFNEFIAVKTGGRDSSAALYWKQFMGDPKSWESISPARQAAKASCPILLIHGTDDTVVPIEQSRRMEAALKKAVKPVEFVTYKGQDHWETVGSARIEMMKAAMAFLGKYNPA
jgi:dienelactone hydrolase